MKRRFAIGVLLLGCLPVSIYASSQADTVALVKKSMVAVGTDQIRRNPRYLLRGTGFAVKDGLHIVTNAHVIREPVDEIKKERLVVFVGSGRDPEVRSAKILSSDFDHDLALLKIDGKPLPVLEIGESDAVREGQQYLFTGYPLGALLGLYPATHQAMIASITPLVIPLDRGKKLNPLLISQLREPFKIFQLDATAFPGNSGSPVYDASSGEVIGVINMVLVKGAKEHMLSDPSGIVYAIPSMYINALFK